MRILNFRLTGLFLPALSFFIFPSCHNSGNSESAAEDSNPDIIKKEVILSPGTQDLLNRFPTPLELTLILRESKAPYVFSLTNPPANISRYFTEKTKALNLGIYSTDLAYSSAYQRAGETEQFIYCTGKLAGDLGIAGVYDKTLLSKVNTNKGNRDSLVALVNRVFGTTGDFLRRNNRNQVAVLVAAGAFVEGVYIASSLCQLARDNSRIAVTLFRQKESFDKLLQILGEYGMDSNIKPVVGELEKLKPVFNSYGLSSGKAVSPKNVAGLVKLAEEVRSEMIK